MENKKVKHDMCALVGKIVKEVYYIAGSVNIMFDDMSQLSFRDLQAPYVKLILRPSPCLKCLSPALEDINLKGPIRTSYYIKCSKCDNRTKDHIEFEDAFEEWENK